MRELFTLICNQCNSKIDILDDGFMERDTETNDINIRLDGDLNIVIECDCGNEIRI